MATKEEDIKTYIEKLMEEHKKAIEEGMKIAESAKKAFAELTKFSEELKKLAEELGKPIGSSPSQGSFPTSPTSPYSIQRKYP
jgi:hypothetical protein